MALIQVQQLHKTYFLGSAEVPALREVDLVIGSGEFAALWGPSGSGKSTLLNLIGLLDRPASGRVLLDGTDTAGLADAELARLRNSHIGFVFQSFNLVPVFSAIENVMLPLLIRGEARGAARLKAASHLAAVGLEGFATHRPDQLSGGQRQRVAIARALVSDPLLVIADEPTANLDARTGQMIVALMRELNRARGVTFLFATHDPRLLDRLDRVVTLADGSIVDDIVRPIQPAGAAA